MAKKDTTACFGLFKCDLVEVCLVLAFISLVVLALLLLAPWRKGGDATQPPVAPCCTNVVTKVLRRANVTVDPCTDFMDYACFNWREDDFRDFFTTDVRGTIIYPTLHGALPDSAAVQIAAYYSSCQAITLQGNDIPQGIVKTLVDEFAFTKSMELTALVRVVTLLSLGYGVDTVLRFFPSVTAEDLTLSVSGVEEVRYLSENDDRLFRDLALSAANSYMGSNVAMTQLQRKFNSRGTSSVHLSRASKGIAYLQSLVQQLNGTFWVTSFEQAGFWNDSMAIAMNDFAWVKSILEELLSNRQKVVTRVYVLVRAAMELGHEAFEAYASDSMATFCYEHVTSLHVPWHLLLTKRLTDPSTDGAVRGMYATILQTVKEELFSDLLAGVPADELGKVDLPRRLLLPSDITVATWPLTKMKSDYWKNLLQVKNFTGLAYRWASSKSLGGLFEATLQPRVASIGKFIVVSPSAYPLLDMNKDVPDFVNAAIFGIRLASAVWRNVYDRNWYLENVGKKFTLLLNCSDVQRRTDSGIFLPYLSLPTIIRAYHAGSTWRALVGTEELGRISRGQLFYMLYFLHSSCQYAARHREHTVDATMMKGILNTFMREVRDFQCTFGCPSTNGAKKCFPTAIETTDCPK